MMDHCRDIELELAAYGSGELGPTEQDLVRNHLDHCPACRGELAREMNLRDTLGSLPMASAPVDLNNRINSAVFPTGKNPGALRGRVRLASAVTLVAASLAVVLLLPALRPVSNPDPTWTQEEIAAARQDVVFTLALTAKVINRTQKDAVVDVFADRLPNAINESFKKAKLTTSGGNG
jgi:anti-sigma factor RsiW